MFHITDASDRVLSDLNNHEVYWSARFDNRLAFPHKQALQVVQELIARDPDLELGMYQEDPQVVISKIAAEVCAIYKLYFPCMKITSGFYCPRTRRFNFLFQHSTNRVANAVHIADSGRINFFPGDSEACFTQGHLKAWTGTHKQPVPFRDRAAIERCCEAMFDYVSARRDEFEWLNTRSVEVG